MDERWWLEWKERGLIMGLVTISASDRVMSLTATLHSIHGQ